MEILKALISIVVNLNVDGDLTDLTKAYLLADELAVASKCLRDDLNKAVAEKMQTRRVILDEVGLLERRRVFTRTEWEHSRLAHKLAWNAVEARQPDSDGVVPDPVMVALDAVLGAAGITYWRLGKLHAANVDDKEFCRVRDDGYRVTIQEGKRE